MTLLFQLAQEIPSTDKLSGDGNLIWFIGFILFLLVVSNTFWVYRDRRVALENIDERKEWERKRDLFDDWKEAAHKKMMKLALRVQKGVEALTGLEINSNQDDEDDA